MQKTSLEANGIDTRQLVEKWIIHWGCAMSEAILDNEFNYFHAPGIDGFIGYRIESDCAVVFGDPVCAVENTPALTVEFQRYCQEKKLNMIFNIVTERFAKWAIKNICSISIEVGEELIFNPQIDPKEGSNGRKLRNKVNHAQHVGLKVHEYLSHDAKLEHSIVQAGKDWLKSRQGPQLYLGKLDFFKTRLHRRWFYLSEGERILGVALLSRLDAYKGYFLKYLIALPEATRGASELMMTSILDTLRQENCHYLTYGIVPAQRLGEVQGVGKITRWLTSTGFKFSKWFFNLENRKIYWQQFQPRIEPLYILFSKPRLRIQDARVVMKTFQIEM